MADPTFKGSPGPWTVQHPCFDQKVPIRGGVTAYGRPYVIAHVNRPGSSYSGQGEANSHLIAAAPDLLAACQALMPVNLCTENPNVPDSTVLPCDITMGEFRQLRAAIDKALGIPVKSEARP